MNNVTLSHNTPTEYRVHGAFEGREQFGRYRLLRFDIYGGTDLERAPADCCLDVEMSWEATGTKRLVSRSASIKLNLSEMMELYAMLGDAIERAQKAQKVAA